MSLDERSTRILTQLMNSETYTPIERITEKLHISRRTVYYDLEKINYWLEDHQLNPVEHVRSLGLYIPDETKQKIPAMIKMLDTWQYYYSEKERKALLAIHLITSTNTVFLKDLMEKIGVSRGTTNTELNKLKEELQNFSLIVSFHRKEGYLIEGSENDKRKALIHYLSQILSKDSWSHLVSEIQLLLNGRPDQGGNVYEKPTLAFVEEHLSMIYQIIDKCEQELGIQMTDEMLHSLALRFIIFSKRLLQGEHIVIDQDEKDVLKSTAEYKAAMNISKELEEMFHMPFPEDEVCYIAMNLLGSKVNYMSHGPESDTDVQHLKGIIQRMVDDFQRFACVFFQERPLIEEKMLIHLKPAYYRIKYGIEVENPLTDSVKEKYSEIFEITKKVVHHFENFIGRSISEKEIAYIAMHFGGWMRREGSKPITRKKALIVCGNGISTSRILQVQLENLLSAVDIVAVVSLREYHSGDYDVDFVVSTAPIEKKDHSVFIVSPILTDAEKEALLNQVNSLMETKARRPGHAVKTLMDVIKRHADIFNEEALTQDLTQHFQTERQNIKEYRKPMLNELITPEMIQFETRVRDWKEAIRIAAEPLLQKGYVSGDYVTAMIDNVLELGPYVVIAPRIAIPHARPDQGVFQMGMSLLCLREGVSFSEDGSHDANLIIVLAAVDKQAHLKAVAQLTRLLTGEHNVDAILEADSAAPVLQLVNQYSTH
ncbi:BglG family transcription antiterminator [Paenibacillus azoreducens]|uniref:BglG family transcription antiterminator n=1 Tax=Paenibacillus azoreducens TaxID=116718 RepID=UPI0039F4E85A